MIQYRRTTSEDPDFLMLVAHLDAELAVLDGEDHAFYAQFNKVSFIHHVVVAKAEDGTAVACGGIKVYSPGTIEVKRMYNLPSCRGKGIASLILAELERWASELKYGTFILETGRRQPDAIALYLKNGYHLIPNYGQYEGMENSVCFAKKLQPT